MPYSYDGIGTGYTKHTNENGWAQTCPHCGKLERLTSFDTHLAFIVLFLPLVRLKRLRIIGYCPSCTKHAQIPHAEWRAKLDRLVDDAKMKLARDDTTIDDALALLNELSALGDNAAFQTLHPLFEAKLGADETGLTALGTVAGAFDAPDVAVRVLEKAIAVDIEKRSNAALPAVDGATVSDASWRALAHVHTLRVEPREALRCYERASAPQDNAALLLIVEAFQLRGLHQEALKLIDRIEQSLTEKERKTVTGDLRRRSQDELKRAEPGWIWTPNLARLRYPGIRPSSSPGKNRGRRDAICNLPRSSRRVSPRSTPSRKFRLPRCDRSTS
jgi:tetratricopeptide (TPR) repeat protein